MVRAMRRADAKVAAEIGKRCGSRLRGYSWKTQAGRPAPREARNSLRKMRPLSALKNSNCDKVRGEERRLMRS